MTVTNLQVKKCYLNTSLCRIAWNSALLTESLPALPGWEDKGFRNVRGIA